MTLRVAFRVDAGKTIGTGHVMETCSLIMYFKKHVKLTPLVITQDKSFTVKKLKEAGVRDFAFLSTGLTQQQEALKIADIAHKHDCRALVVNLIRRSALFYRRLHQAFPNTFVILDNDIRERIDGARVINFSIVQNKRKPSGSHELLGTRYIPLSTQLLKLSARTFNREVQTIFVNQGGSDPYDLTFKIIKAFERIETNANIQVVLGGAASPSQNREINALKRSLKHRYFFYRNVSQEKMFSLIRSSDLAVSAAGNTLYEICYLGVPTVVIGHHALHDKVANAFAREGAVVNLGIGRNLKEEKMVKGLTRVMNDFALRRKLHQKAKAVCDGKGNARIAKLLIKTLNGAYES